MRWLVLALFLFSSFPVRGNDLVPLPHLESRKEFWRLYSRGNDDFDEADEAGTSNFETSLIRATLVAGRNEIGSISLWLLYNATLTTDNYNSIHKPSYKIVKKSEGGNESIEEETSLRVIVGPGGGVMDSVLSGSVLLQGFEITPKEESYSGKVTVEFIPVGLLNGKVIRETIEYIDWEITVKAGEILKLNLNLTETNREGRRSGAEVLLPLRSSNSPDILSKGFPTKVGKVVRKKPKEIGVESE